MTYRSVSAQKVVRATAAPVAASAPDSDPVVALALFEVSRDGGTQMRAGLNVEACDDYRDHFIAAGGWGNFPAVDVLYDGSNYWLWDGFHRMAGFEAALLKAPAKMAPEVRARVRPGTQRDAILLAAGANSKNGVRRSVDDKRRAVDRLLADPEWGSWSNVEIGRRCGVSDVFVGDRRKIMDQSRAVAAGLSGAPAPVRSYRDRWGNVAEMNVSGQKAAGAARSSASGGGGSSVVASSATATKQAGVKLGECSVCGRPLSDPVHVAAGVGPVCACKGQGGAGGDGAALVASGAVKAITGRMLAVVDDLGAYEALTGDDSGARALRQGLMSAIARLAVPAAS